MYKNNENQAEAWVNEKILQILQEDETLAGSLCHDGLLADQVTNPGFADYLADLVIERLQGRKPSRENIRSILRGHAMVRRDVQGTMMTQRTELWERYPLEALLRLLWRNRREEGEIIFLRGNEPVDRRPCFWRAETRREGDKWVLTCRDEAGRNKLYMTTACEGYEMDRKTFGHELRDFLGFHEGSVWLSHLEKVQVTEVTE